MNKPRKMPRAAVVVGLGVTGLSCVRHLLAHGVRVRVTDSREDPPGRAELAQFGAQVTASLGGLDTGLLDEAICVVVSPGVPLSDPFILEARRRGLTIIGDIELFAAAADAPVVGITGTNGKSTVTTLVGNMARRAGARVRVGGNLGTPALDLLLAEQADAEPAELYVLELSSYQLELTSSLELRAAAVLNVTPDHMDRYASLAAYAEAKARIFARCDTAVINLDDPLVAGMAQQAARVVGFSLKDAPGADYTVAVRAAGRPWLICRGEPLMPVESMRIKGLHNAANALAALALGEAVELPLQAMLEELASFAGLPHRSQWVAEVRGVAYVDDSKGTNVGATLAAVAGLTGPLIVIAGGDGKSQDFTPLRDAFRGKVRRVVLIGRDAPALEKALHDVCPTHRSATLPEAVRVAAQLASPGDTVLLSPACASLDMFRNYAHRGDVFSAAVRELAA
ncbi:MAG TPA: UDP-N-acetylmuramoyl-L-alanine--D-glutamate ligase [Steroidobacteraceae bacterium]|nr:UDP-N-acetylmuramoyl-L-alanine--D-glutamate ligase [Steroidobacteraceae bacterium]